MLAAVVALARGGNLHLFEFGYLENQINRKHKPRVRTGSYDEIGVLHYMYIGFT